MKINKRAAVHPMIWILSVILIIGVVVGTVSYFSNNKTAKVEINYNINPSKTIGEAINQPSLDWTSYFVGKVPQFLIDKTNTFSAVIIVVAIWLILLLTFGDIVSAFGTFSEKWIGWTIGSILAIIAANMNIVMWIAAWSFMATSALGVLSVATALAIPFVVFLLVQFGLTNIAEWQRKRKNAYDHARGVDNITQGARTLGAVGRTTKEEGKKNK